MHMKKPNSCTFCMHPFTGLATREDGAIKICCRSAPIGHIDNETLEQAWNNETMRKVRQQVLKGERPEVCAPCFNLEDQGVESLRQRHINGVIPEARINLYPDALDDLADDFTMPFQIPTMELKTNNLCNLRCRMCNPLDSTQWSDWNEVEEFYVKEGNFLPKTVKDLNLQNSRFQEGFADKDHFWENLERNAPYFRRVEFAGGEPLMDPNHYRILDMLAPYGNNIEIKYATNGTTLGIKGGRTIHDYWPKFKSVAVNVSIDGIHDVYNYIRGNGDFKTVEENVKVFQSFPNISRVVGAFTVQAGNIMQICDVIDYFINKMGIVFYSHRVTHPRALSAQTLPNDLKDKIVFDLNQMRTKILEYPLVKQHKLLEQVTLQQINDNINFLQANDLSDYWPDCVAFNHKLDVSRNQGPFEKVIPEFAPYV